MQEIFIGSQIWSTNLDLNHFRNGDLIPEAKSDEDWNQAGEKHTPAWCYFNNDPDNNAIFGKLYNFYAVNDPRGLARLGWHIPNREEVSLLLSNLEGELNPFGYEILGKSLKSTDGWIIPKGLEDEFKMPGGTNLVGFSGLPGGIRFEDGFDEPGKSANWWTTSCDKEIAYSFYLFTCSNLVYKDKQPKCNGLSVRCIKDL